MASIGSSGEGGGGSENGLVTPGNNMRGGGVCGHVVAVAANRTPQRIETRQAQGARAGSGSGSPDSVGACKIGRRHHDGDAETAELWLRGRGLRPRLARRRQDHDKTTGRRDDQPPRGGFGRTQQPQYGEPEMAGQCERGFHLPLAGRSAVVDGRVGVFAASQPHPNASRILPGSRLLRNHPGLLGRRSSHWLDRNIGFEAHTRGR